MANIKKKVLVSIEVVNWELQVETGKNHGKVDSLSQWLHTVLNGCGPKWNASWSQFLQIFITHSPQFSARVHQSKHVAQYNKKHNDTCILYI